MNIAAAVPGGIGDGSGKTLPESIAEQLRTLIIRGAISPGQHLGQSELAEQFGRSKVPIREALKQLAAEGLLRHDPNKGFFVARMSREEAVQLYRLRRWIEAELLGTARWPNRQEIADFRRRFRALDALECEGDRLAWASALKELRYGIFDLSPEKVLLREALRLWGLTDRYRSMLPRDTSGSGERQLVDALAARDREALLKAYHVDRDRIEALLIGVFEEPSGFSRT